MLRSELTQIKCYPGWEVDEAFATLIWSVAGETVTVLENLPDNLIEKNRVGMSLIGSGHHRHPALVLRMAEFYLQDIALLPAQELFAQR